MGSTIRKLPVICLLISIRNLLFGRLKFSSRYLNRKIRMKDGSEYKIFRHITSNLSNQNENGCVFVVSFKFALLSYEANKITSIIPMFMIAGFPGFIKKIYAVNPVNGYWQGMYEWKSKEHLEEYKKSFIFRMMNKRAIPDTIKSFELIDKKLSEFIDENLI